MLRITSRDNPRLIEAAQLLSSARARRKRGLCVLEGVHLVRIHVARVGLPRTLLVLDDHAARAEVAALVAAMPAANVLSVSRALLAGVAATSPDVGVLAIVPMPDSAAQPLAARQVLLDGVQDPGNVGTILRTAAAAGVDQVLLSRDCAAAWSPKALRAAQGAHFLVHVAEDVDLPAWSHHFHAAGGSVVATAATGGDDLYAASIDVPWALAIGNEGAGLSPGLAAAATRTVTIPMPGGMESLNAAAAAAVVLFELVRQQRNRRV